MYHITKKNDELYHHGILGQKWGIRRYQNPDGTLTAEGRARLKNDDKFRSKYNRYKRSQELMANKGLSKTKAKLAAKYEEKGMTEDEAIATASRNVERAKAIAITAGAVGAATAATILVANPAPVTAGIAGVLTKISPESGFKFAADAISKGTLKKSDSIDPRNLSPEDADYLEGWGAMMVEKMGSDTFRHTINSTMTTNGKLDEGKVSALYEWVLSQRN